MLARCGGQGPAIKNWLGGNCCFRAMPFAGCCLCFYTAVWSFTNGDLRIIENWC
jgi:hypothetical protein